MIELKNNPAGNFFLLAGPCVIEGDFAAHQNAGAAEYLTRRGRRAGKPPVCRSPRSRNGK